jgi:hypothetical protein
MKAKTIKALVDSARAGLAYVEALKANREANEGKLMTVGEGAIGVGRKLDDAFSNWDRLTTVAMALVEVDEAEALVDVPLSPEKPARPLGLAETAIQEVPEVVQLSPDTLKACAEVASEYEAKWWVRGASYYLLAVTLKTALCRAQVQSIMTMTSQECEWLTRGYRDAEARSKHTHTD